MKIACILENLRTYGGTQIQCIRVAEHLVKLHHEVQIITTSFDPLYSRGIEKMVRVSAISVGSRNRMKEFAKRIAGIIDDADWLLVFDWDVYRLKHFLPSMNVCWICNDPPYWKKYLGKPGVFKRIQHEALRQYGLRKERHYIRKLDVIIVLDEKNREFLLRHYGVPAIVIRSGIDPDCRENLEAEMPLLRQLLDQYHLKPKMFVLSIGIAYRHRNFEAIINAMQYVRQEVQLIIVAPGVYDEEYLVELRSMAAHDQRIHILDRFVSEAEKRILYRNALCFVFPNKNQTWGLAPLESLMYETIPIVSRECGVSEVLQDNEFALLFSPDDHSELARKIEFVCDNHAICDRIVKAGSSFVTENLTWDKYVRNILRAIGS